MADKNIPFSDIPGTDKSTQRIYTAQELLIGGGSVVHPPQTEEEWRIPQAILDGDDPVDVREARVRHGHIRSAMYSQIFGIKEGPICIELAPIDSRGKTVHIPRIIGVEVKTRNKTKIVKKSWNLEDLNKRLFRMFKDAGIDLHLREEASKIEQEVPRAELKG